MLVYYFLRGLCSTFLLCHHIKHIGFKQQPVICHSLMGWVGSWVCPHFAESVITWRLNWAAVSKKGHFSGWVLTQLSAGLRYTPPTSPMWPFHTMRLASEKNILWLCQEKGNRSCQLSEVDLNFLRMFLVLPSLDQSSHIANLELKDGKCSCGRGGMCTRRSQELMVAIFGGTYLSLKFLHMSPRCAQMQLADQQVTNVHPILPPPHSQAMEKDWGSGC